MPRPRKPKNAKLPAYVYKAKGRYFYRPYLGRRDGRTIWGKEVRLASEDASIAQVWKAFNELEGGHTAGALGWLAEKYFASPQFARLARKTKDLYDSYWLTIGQTQTNSGSFADIPLSAISPGVIRRYLDRRADVPHQANKERSFLCSLFSFAVERDWMTSNPAQQTKPFPVESRTRYVNDEEYRVIFDRSLPYVQACMEISYLCRARMSEVLSLKKEAIGDDGLLLLRGKGSKTQKIGWTERLRKAVAWCDEHYPDATSEWIVHRNRGGRVSRDTLQSTWGRKMRKALADGLLNERYSFHDLKAKGVSDFDGDKFKASGHKSPSMLSVYDRKIEVVKSTR